MTQKLNQWKETLVGVILALVLVISGFYNGEITSYAMETGIAISSAEDLEKLRYSQPGMRYYLTNDINMHYYGLWEPIEEFKGVLDGNGHVIEGLTSNQGGLIKYLGENATVENLILKDVNINVTAYEYSSIGGIVGSIDGSSIENEGGVIKKCAVAGEIRITTNGDDSPSVEVGGIVGGGMGMVIECFNCSIVEIECNSRYFDSYLEAGGIAGNMKSIYNCINKGSAQVSNDSLVVSQYCALGAGGIASRASKVMNCYSSGYTSAFSRASLCSTGWIGSGGILAYADNDTYVYGCYETSGKPFGVEKETTATANYVSPYEFADKKTFKEFDFNNVWDLEKGIEDSQPFLRWMQPHITLPSPYADMKKGVYENPINVDLFDDVKGATIYYTTDGSTPTKDSPVYNKTIKITKNTTLKTLAIYGDYKNSKVVTYQYKIKVKKPTANVRGGTRVKKGTKIRLVSSTKGATIYYTTDGRTPTTKSKKYTKPIVINKNATIRAIAVKDGMTQSSIVNFRYILKK